MSEQNSNKNENTQQSDTKQNSKVKKKKDVKRRGLKAYVLDDSDKLDTLDVRIRKAVTQVLSEELYLTFQQLVRRISAVDEKIRDYLIVTSDKSYIRKVVKKMVMEGELVILQSKYKEKRIYFALPENIEKIKEKIKGEKEL